jgi:hypothetical protein
MRSHLHGPVRSCSLRLMQHGSQTSPRGETIYREIDRGSLPALHVGRLLRIDPHVPPVVEAE